ncbi:MAG: hypothetical protein M1540_10010 [Candidatus Bathyarchaeota archaeon]|nr:hypothetical protein [Candidatus Bathyarchaeota archaeon]
MTKPNFYSPLKIGFLIVAVAYFLFTFQGMFTLSWVGEWEAFDGSLRLIIFAEDISAAIGVAFRLVASAIALGAVILYFARRGLPTSRVKKLFRLVVIGEAIYWLGLLTTAVLSLTSSFGITIWRVNGHVSTIPMFTSLLIYEIPLLIESIVIPAVLFKLSHELAPNKPVKSAIKWGLIAGTVYILVFWLTSTTMWVSTVLRQGIHYLTSYPENLLSFSLTSFGLLALTIFTGYFAKKSIGTEKLEKLGLRTIGGIVTALGLLYLSNYLIWLFFGRDETWSYWYLWFLGNLNMWLLSLPMAGLPLLFTRKSPPEAATTVKQ